MSASMTFEEAYGPVERRVRRALRFLRWHIKGALGLSRTILVETRWRLGDEIMALPIYEALRLRYPQCRVEVLCTYPDLLEDHPHVDRVNSSGPDPDRYILLRGAPRDVYRLEEYARRAGVPVPHARPRLYAKRSERPLSFPQHEDGKIRIGVATGASWSTKRLPVASWRELGAVLDAQGYGLVEVGVAGEEIGIGESHVGRTTVGELAALLKSLSLVICNDSGVMHLALAVGTPVIALFGPTTPSMLVRDEPLFHPVSNARVCRGCWNTSQTMREPGVCPLERDDCMASTCIETICTRVESILERQGYSHDALPARRIV